MRYPQVMVSILSKLNPFVTAAFAAVIAFPLHAEEAVEQRLLRELKDPQNTAWQRTESDLQREWSRSGSASMDLLLQRGRDAMETGDTQEAIEHLTALTDHAPDFAEGWNALASAYFQAGKFGPAVDDIRRTLALNPNHYGALSGLGMILEDMGYDASARDAYRAAQAIHPHQPDIEKAVERLDREMSGQAL
ncbi:MULTISPECIES: tetratricopeptide repeat protein [unclassified Haematobacter]|uniref:tetratricopeptide repeat protein n=1 Tax=unclassified Haematobacter TaxID=2640585 RepID=UPI0025C1E621|nr:MULTISPECIES: tetratricopeptide repeat protein [unclassified Haematobacter]